MADTNYVKTIIRISNIRHDEVLPILAMTTKRTDRHIARLS